MSRKAKAIDLRRALFDLRDELIREAYSARLPLKVADRKKRIIAKIEKKLAGRPLEAPPDGRS